MKLLPLALIVCAASMLALPAVATTEVGLVAPADSTAPAAQLDAAVLSPRAEAVKAALDQAGDGGDASEKAVLEEVRGFYEHRNFELVWLGDRQPSRQMHALRRRMDGAAADGLDPALYATPGLAQIYPDDPSQLAAADVGFSRAVARFVTHLASGRMRPAELSRIITLEPERPDIGEALARLSRTPGVSLALSRFEPPQGQYRELKQALAELRANDAAAPQIVVPEGPLLRPGKKDERVALLRARFELVSAAGEEPDIYDPALVEAVTVFQADTGLNADGIVGPRTLAALNGPDCEEDIAAIVANMERWRWMPRDLGAFHVFVNIPEFMVRVVQDGATVHETRVVVGTPQHATPTFSHVMDHLVVNPFWNVPTSIVTNEMLPEIRRNPYGYFSRRGYQVLARVGGRMRVINPNYVDWWMVNPRSIRIRQVPGDFNALGRIKFMFPNQHSVYLHDTPSKSLFERDQRAFSHGCVRVDNPLDFADAILPVAAPEWNSGRLAKLFGGKERRIDLDNPVPVHLSYFTRVVDADGTLRRFEDIYGYDRDMRTILDLSVHEDVVGVLP